MEDAHYDGGRLREGGVVGLDGAEEGLGGGDGGPESVRVIVPVVKDDAEEEGGRWSGGLAIVGEVEEVGGGRARRGGTYGR